MATSPSLRVRISADLNDIKQGLGMLRGELAKVQQGAARVRPPDTSGWSKGLAAVRSQLLGIVSLYGAMRVGGAYIRMADEASSLTSQLRLATKSQQEFKRAYDQSFQIAQETSAEWGAIVGLYTQLSRSAGMGQEETLAFTRTLSQMFAVSGKGQADTARGIVQLQQAMAGGVLRAQEFQTLLETNDRLVQALADHFGISFGQVRKYVNDGKVGVDDLREAVRKAGAEVDGQFRAMPLTVAKATTQVRNALLKLVGDTDAAGGASKELAEAIADMARVLESDDTKRGFGEIVNALSAIVEFSTKAAAMMGKLNREVKDLSGVSLPKWAQASLMALSGNIPAAVRAYGSGRNPRPDFSNVTTGSSTGAAAGADVKPPTGETAKAIAASNALLRDSVQRALAELDQLYKGHEIGMRDYFASRQQLQEQAIDLQIQQARNELAVTKDLGKRRDLEEQIAILLRDRADVASQAAREQQSAEDELIDKLGELKATIAELDGDHVRAARIRIESEFLDLFKRLRAESDSAGEAMARNLVDRLVRKAQTDAIASTASGITSRLSSEESSVSAQVDAGMLGFVEGQERLRQARMLALEQLREQIRLQNEVMTKMDPGGPEHAAAMQGLHELETGYANVAASIDTFRNQVKDLATDSLTGFFMDLVEGTKSAADAFRDFVRSFALGMAQMAARALATYAILSLMEALWPGSAQLVTGGAKVAGKQYHSGGKVGGAGGVMRWIPEILLTGAPRFHGGGLVGASPLKQREVAAVLEMGETVRTRQQENALQARLDAGSGKVLVKQPIVAIGDRAVADAMASAAGEDIVLTHVRNNWNSLQASAR